VYPKKCVQVAVDPLLLEQRALLVLFPHFSPEEENTTTYLVIMMGCFIHEFNRL
jgi:hypothetical protein